MFNSWNSKNTGRAKEKRGWIFFKNSKEFVSVGDEILDVEQNQN